MNDGEAGASAWDLAYPAALARREQVWLALRNAAVRADEAGERLARATDSEKEDCATAAEKWRAEVARRQAEIDIAMNADSEPAPAGSRIGFALSGGGIRSATFSLGVFQGLARLGLLSRIDYLSTVSGGGYFGAFLGRLFARDYASPKTAEYLLRPDQAAQPRPAALITNETRAVDPFGWLRENGRYLAPNGSGDVQLAFAVAVRNWVALNLVFGSFVLLLLMLAQWLCLPLAWAINTLGSPALADQMVGMSGFSLVFSPYLNLLPPLFLGTMFPLGWAYFLVERAHAGQARPIFGVLLLLALCGGAFTAANHSLTLWTAPPWWSPLFKGLTATALLTIAFYGWIWFAAAARDGGVTVTDADSIDRYSRARNEVSRWLAMMVKIGLAVLAFAIVDSFGRTLYLHYITDQFGSLWTGIFGLASAPIVIRVLRVPALLSKFGAGKATRLQLPMEVLAGVAAVLLAVILLTALDAFAIAATRGFAGAGMDAPQFAEALARGLAAAAEPGRYRLAVAALLTVALFSGLFGRTWPFLNRSSQAALYAARLTRAYLGASNPRRFVPDRESSVADAIDDDDTVSADYWKKAVGNGGPLHLINVTINETTGDSEKTVVRDRKGIGLAVGPCGFSAGVRHHALYAAGNDAAGYQPIEALLGDHRPYSMFARRPQPGAAQMMPANQVEKLTLGQWIGISGAAFSTGIGSRTTLGLSLLMAFANVRLGYWWDAGARLGRQREGSLLRRLFPVQGYLLDEFTASFRGPDVRRWYLSDGGHFENMGAYELIRRRLPMIVIVDGEADPDYTYEGLANLVRKARLDFGADIRFLDTAEMKGWVHAEVAPLFGALDDLRPVAGDNNFSKHRAALAEVRYDGSEQRSLLVYLKPTLAAQDPADVRGYLAKNADFPQQTTLDQFFDEAQWESYRKLGEHIATRVFAAPDVPDAKHFSPHALAPVFPTTAQAPAQR